MKNLYLFIGLLLCFNNLIAQKKVVSTTKSAGIEHVYLHLKFANNIIVKNWNKSQVLVEAMVNLKDNQENDYFSLKPNQIGKTLSIKSDYGNFFKDHRRYHSDGQSYSSFKHIVNYVIYVPKQMSLKIKSISGDVVADKYKGYLELDLISGNIDIKKHSNKMKLKTISGDIDVFISDATFEAKTISGGIFSDLDIDFSKTKKRYSHQQKIIATINKGTASLKLNTISGDIFLRKI